MWVRRSVIYAQQCVFALAWLPVLVEHFAPTVWKWWLEPSAQFPTPQHHMLDFHNQDADKAKTPFPLLPIYGALRALPWLAWGDSRGRQVTMPGTSK